MVAKAGKNKRQSKDVETSENDKILSKPKSRLTKEQKKQIAAQADDETNAISIEVNELLAHLKKGHDLSDDESMSANDKGNKKSKIVDAKWQETKSDDLSEVQAQTSTLPCNHMGVKNTSTLESTKKIRKEKNNDSIAYTVLDNVSKNKRKLKKNKKRKNSFGEQNDAIQSTNPSSLGLQKNTKKERITQAESDDDKVSLASKDSVTVDGKGQAPKTEYYLKNAFPVYIGNLPTNTKKKRLRKLLQPYGDILAIRFRTNTGKAFMKADQLKKVPFIVAFAYFSTEKSAAASLKLSGQKIGENIIYVDRDLDKKDVKSKMNAKTTVFVGNLKYQTTNDILRDIFKCCGGIEYIRIIQCKLGCNGTAYVCFKNPESVDLALKLNKTLVLDREVRVERFHTKKLGGGKSRENKPQLHGAALRVSKKIGHQGNEAKGKSLTSKLHAKPENIVKKKEFLGTKSNLKKKNSDAKCKRKTKISTLKKLARQIAPKSV